MKAVLWVVLALLAEKTLSGNSPELPTILTRSPGVCRYCGSRPHYRATLEDGRVEYGCPNHPNSYTITPVNETFWSWA